MGFVGLLQFAVRYCIGVLAWPVISLGYPLCASIKAIETNSVSDTQKLNTYWVTFSLILLFEHAFARLFEWLVIWPYIRLMIVSWLVIPYFDGSFYIYNHLIRPCLSVDPQIVIDWFNKRKESYILTEMERYVKENGPEALEKILASKSGSTKPNLDVQEIESVSSIENKMLEKLNSGSPNVTQKDIKSVEALEKKEVRAAAEQVSRVEPNLTQVENINFAAPEIKKMVPEVVVAAHRELPKTPAPPDHEVQKWTCEICLATTTSEKSLKRHYRRKHKSETQDVPTLIPNNSDRPAVEPRNSATSKGCLGNVEVQGQQVSRVEPNLTQVENLNFAAPEIKRMVPEVVVAAHRELPKAPAPPDHEVQKWTCEICLVTTTSEKSLKRHYRRKHKSETQDVPTFIPNNSDRPAVEARNSATSKGCLGNVEVQGQQVSRVEPNLTQVENINIAATEIKKMVPEVVVAAHRELPKTPAPPDVQKWTCEICQVTTTSEKTLKRHYRRKHKSKTQDVPTFIPNNSDRPAVEPRNCATSKGCLGNVEVQGQPQSIHASAARKSEPKEEPTTSSSGIKQKVNVKPEEEVFVYEGSNFGVKSSSVWWCSICNVSCPSEINNMLGHIKGRKHSRLIKLSTGM